MVSSEALSDTQIINISSSNALSSLDMQLKVNTFFHSSFEVSSVNLPSPVYIFFPEVSVEQLGNYVASLSMVAST